MVSDTKKYYDKLKKTNPQKYKDTRLAQQKRYNEGKGGGKRTGREITKAANAANRAKGTYGNHDGKDVAHKPGKKGSRKAKDVTLQSPSKNRASRLKIRNA